MGASIDIEEKTVLKVTDLANKDSKAHIMLLEVW